MSIVRRPSLVLVLIACSTAQAQCRWLMPLDPSPPSDRTDSPADISSSERLDSAADMRDEGTSDIPRTEGGVVQDTTSLFSTRDTMLDEVGPDLNYGTCAEIYLLNALVAGGQEHYRPLFFFDLSSIPPACTVDQATLVLPVQDTPDEDVTVSVYQLTEDWDEGQYCSAPGSNHQGAASWNSCKTAQSWTAAGGTFVLNPVAKFTIVKNGTYGSWDVTALVQAWFKGSAANHGVILDASYETGPILNYVSFYTHDAAADKDKPRLQVTHTCPAP
jgi:hypothetical protein